MLIIIIMLQLAEDGCNITAIYSKWNNIVARMKGKKFLTVTFQAKPANSHQIPGLWIVET